MERPSPDATPLPPADAPLRTDDARHGILASVALKAATATRGIAGEPQEILDTAKLYLTWLRRA